MKRAGAQELFSYAVFFLCLSVVLFARAGKRPTGGRHRMMRRLSCKTTQMNTSVWRPVCRQGRVDVIEYWLSQKGFKPNDEFIRGCRGDRVSGLWVASQKGHTAGVKLLIKAGADLNQCSDDGATPLFMASQNGHVEVVEILVKAGADLNQIWNDATPLFQASQNGHVEVVEFLVKAGADLNQSPDNGAPPLFMASQNGHIEIVEILIKAGADPLKQWHRNDLFYQSSLEAARLRKFICLTNSETRKRYALIIQTLKPAVKSWKEQKKIQAQIDGNTGCFDGFVDALKHEIKHTVAPFMKRAPLKSKGY